MNAAQSNNTQLNFGGKRVALPNIMICIVFSVFSGCSSTEVVDAGWQVAEPAPVLVDDVDVAILDQDLGLPDVQEEVALPDNDPYHFAMSERMDTCPPKRPEDPIRRCSMSPWAAHPELYDHLAFRLFFGSPLTSLYTYPGSTVGRILVTIAFPDSLDPHPRTFEYFHRHWAWAGTWSETTYTYNQSVEV